MPHLRRPPPRRRRSICVVEEPKDVVAIERTREFRGRYHVLGGAISPIEGVGPDDLRIRELLTRLADGRRSPSSSSPPTRTSRARPRPRYLARLPAPMGLKVTRLATGLPVGGDLEYADEVTLGRAFEGRRLSMPTVRRTPVTTPSVGLPRRDESAATRGPTSTTVTEVASGAAPDAAHPAAAARRCRSCSSTGARLGAIEDVVPAERFEPDAGPDPDVDPLRAGPRQPVRGPRRLRRRRRPADSTSRSPGLAVRRPRRDRRGAGPRPAALRRRARAPRRCGGGSSATCPTGASARPGPCACCSRCSATSGSTPTRRPSPTPSSTRCTPRG